MAISSQTLIPALTKLKRAIDAHEQDLNAADAKLGDGDTGGMLARVITRMAETDLDGSAPLGQSLSLLARQAAAATGSSLGTLIATALLAIARETKDAAEIDTPRLAALLLVARDAMMARGKAELGDKTVLDSVDAIAKALAENPSEPAKAAAQAAQEACDGFRDKPNRVGRARMFADRSIGIEDPGMLAMARLAPALVKEG